MQLSELIRKDPVIERVAKAEEVTWFTQRTMLSP